MSLCIFDLDNTLLAGDSDHAWGQYLVEQGYVDGAAYARENERYYAAYKDGNLDIFDYLAFALKPLTAHPRAQLDRWHADFMKTKIEPMITREAHELVEKHRDQGDTLMIITATNHFVTAPIARAFGIDILLATDPEVVDGEYTGRVAGTPCFAEGKVERLSEWLADNKQSLAGSTFYSDSHNDLPLMERVDHPVAVNPDATLREVALARGWPIVELLHPQP